MMTYSSTKKGRRKMKMQTKSKQQVQEM